MTTKYVRSDSLSRRGDVFYLRRQGAPAVAFLCPCGQRQVYVESPTHTISFDEQGRLTLKGSCGYSERRDSQGRIVRKKNWCHFSVADGEAKMHPKAECPGQEMI